MNEQGDLDFPALLLRLRADRIEREQDPLALETCDLCECRFPVRFIRFTGRRFLCPTCEARDPDPELR